jgi:hypothetical protein
VADNQAEKRIVVLKREQRGKATLSQAFEQAGVAIDPSWPLREERAIADLTAAQERALKRTGLVWVEKPIPHGF